MSSTSAFDTLLRQFGPTAIDQISQQLGVDPQTARAGVETGLPLLLSALARNAQTQEGAESLSRALARDHDGSALQNLSSILSGAQVADGAGIVGHVLGSQRQVVEQDLSQQLGIDGGSLLNMLAPVVLGQLGQMQRQQGLDAGGLASVLQKEQQSMSGSGILGGLVGQILGGALGGSPSTGIGGRRAPSGTGLEGLLGGGPLVQMMLGTLGPGLIATLARRFGVSESTVKRALMIAIPLLLAALARNAQSGKGANSLLDALTRDHSQGVNNLDQVLANPSVSQGDKIIKHVLGSKASGIEETITQTTGVDGGQLLQTLAPILMGVLGQQVSRKGMDANSLAQTLQNEEQELASQNTDVMQTVREVLGSAPDQDQGGLLGALGRLFGG